MVLLRFIWLQNPFACGSCKFANHFSWIYVWAGNAGMFRFWRCRRFKNTYTFCGWTRNNWREYSTHSLITSFISSFYIISVHSVQKVTFDEPDEPIKMFELLEKLFVVAPYGNQTVLPPFIDRILLKQRKCVEKFGGKKWTSTISRFYWAEQSIWFVNTISSFQ